MRDIRPIVLAIFCCAGAAAHAQTGAAPGNGDAAAAQAATPATVQDLGTASASQGFFAPTPGNDPSLFRTLPAEAYPSPSRANAAPVSAAAPAAAPVVVVVPERNAMQEQLDRAARDAEEERARTLRYPAPVNGAFTGLTDERDR